MRSLQAINLYGERPYLQPELQEARDFVQATEHSKQLTNAFRADIQKYWDELESARRKLQVLTQSSPAVLCCCTVCVCVISDADPDASMQAWPVDWGCKPPFRAGNQCRASGQDRVLDEEGVIACPSLVSRVQLPPLQELACVDLSMEIAERALEVVRGSIESAAARERDEAAARLLSELELEDASKKVSLQAVLWKESF